jgi:hypothetical protein
MKKITLVLAVLFLTMNVFAKDVAMQIELGRITGSEVPVRLKIENSTNQIICLYGVFLGLSGSIGNEVFEVTLDGKAVDYIGGYASRDPKELPIIKLVPRSVITIELDISESYDFSQKGTYMINYKFLNATNCSIGKFRYKFDSNIIYFEKK